MSKTYTAKPSYSKPDRGRGRGNRARGATNTQERHTTNTRQAGGQTPNRRGRGSPMYQAQGYGRGQSVGRGRGGEIGSQRHVGNPSGDLGYSEHALADTDRPGGNGQAERQMERRDAYSVMKPNQEKRDKITTQAKKEEEAYRQHKQNNTPQFVSSSGTLGGGMVQEETVRKQAQHQQVRAKFNSQQKSQQYREKERQREDEKHEKKKIEQRRKTDENRRKEKERNSRARDDHSSGKEKWLDQLDRQAREAKSKKLLSSTAAKKYTSEISNAGHSAETQQLRDHSPGVATSLPGPAEGATASFSESGDDESEMTPLDELVKMFPQYVRVTLEDILFNCNGNVQQAHSLLAP